jgi:hypothetical protein
MKTSTRTALAVALMVAFLVPSFAHADGSPEVDELSTRVVGQRGEEGSKE